ncbi:GNAT family N-acetyltransferase [Actinospica durhamensis]|uniref:GNAT family N-acetyltransferase n=1 Tax=Actinospica durhamensis TaxID=1508375 RepID=A0A941EID7_9ACTN|nr:GNAT family N-acetyltransferase [Actinospica durhamensis]MBR7831931.1 GNAT family N-acetyltransferase [Actinospica durhamensis]
MTIALSTPGVTEFHEVLAALRDWQHDKAPLELHPGDLGWACSHGVEKVVSTVRTWSRDSRIVAVGFLDQPDLLRLAVAPELQRDEATARVLIEDFSAPERGVLPAGAVYLAAANGTLVKELLLADGWKTDDAWTPLSLDLAEPVQDPGLRIEVADSDSAHVWIAVTVAAWEKSTFSMDRWHALAAGPAFSDARFLIAYDDQDTPVANIGVWLAGPGKPGLIEPLGTHRDHRHQGHGRAITLAGAAALRAMGSSSAFVCTQNSLAGAVATYKSAGFTAGAERLDISRSA